MATPLTRKEWLTECGKLAEVYEDAMTNPKHTSSDLVKRLIDTREYHCMMYSRYDTVTEAADRIEALEAEVERLRMANRALRRGLYGLMDSDDADTIATTLETGGVVGWDKYPPSARAALEARGLEIREIEN